MTRQNATTRSIVDDFESLLSFALSGMPQSSSYRTTTSHPSRAIESDDAVTISIDAPGLDSESIDVSVDNGVLSVTAQRPTAPVNDGERLLYDQTHTKKLRFARRLPDEIDTDQITASYRQGVLAITVPKSVPPSPKRVKITLS